MRLRRCRVGFSVCVLRVSSSPDTGKYVWLTPPFYVSVRARSRSLACVLDEATAPQIVRAWIWVPIIPVSARAPRQLVRSLAYRPGPAPNGGRRARMCESWRAPSAERVWKPYQVADIYEIFDSASWIRARPPHPVYWWLATETNSSSKPKLVTGNVCGIDTRAPVSLWFLWLRPRRM